MPNNRIFRVLALAIILSLLMISLPATPALAAAYIYASPDEGEVGDEINVYGYGFSAGARVYIYFSSEEAEVNDYLDEEVNAYHLVKSTYAGATGSSIEGEIDVDFEVPDELTGGSDDVKVRGGDYYIYTTSSTSKKITAVVNFTVIGGGGTTIDPDKGPVGTEVEISGEGFDAKEVITVEYDGDEVDIESGDEKTDSNGEFECTIIIPPSAAGAHTITVIGEDSDFEAEAEFTVEPQLTISPESGGAGTTVTVSGTGFGKSSDVTIYLAKTEVATKETDKDGSFEVTFTVPALGLGTYDVEAEDEDDNTNKVKFTVAASASFSPTSGYVGTKVTVSGTGFKVNTPITITFDASKVTTSPDPVSTDAKGSFSGSFSVPSRAKGTYKVKVTDGSNTKEADFSVMTSATISPVTSAASPGHIGTELTISGIGFMAGKTVTIVYDNTKVATATVKSDGTVAASFKVPASQHGEHNITATDGTVTEQFAFTMESTVPPIPVPLEPEMGIKTKAEAYFDWKDVTDPSGVTYTLQIASDKDFKSIVLEKEGLTDSEYTITKGEKLKSVSKEEPYYWHVKATDGASNEGEWTGAGSFCVGFSLVMPQWSIYILFGIGALLFGFLGFWMGRKTAYY